MVKLYGDSILVIPWFITSSYLQILQVHQASLPVIPAYNDILWEHAIPVVLLLAKVGDQQR